MDKRQAWTMVKLGGHALGRKTLARGHCSTAGWRTRGARELIATVLWDRMLQLQHVTASNR